MAGPSKNPRRIFCISTGAAARWSLCSPGHSCPEAGELEKFSDAYTAFLTEIRRVNGADTQIICALGPMNYYLFHDIAEAVRRYCQRTGDKRVHVLRLCPMHPFDGIGADGHPSLDTREKMAQELTCFIRSLENQ